MGKCLKAERWEIFFQDTWKTKIKALSSSASNKQLCIYEGQPNPTFILWETDFLCMANFSTYLLYNQVIQKEYKKVVTLIIAKYLNVHLESTVADTHWN